MKLARRKLLSIGLGSLLAFSMVGCGSTASQEPSGDASTESSSGTTPAASEGTSATAEEVVKPEKITMMVNGTFLDKASGQDAVVAAYKDLTGIDLEINTIDHNAYNDQLALAFASGDVPDVVILSAEYYAAYANQGALADLTDYWNNSDTKASGRVNETYVDALKINDRLYAFAPARGNGCITYLRQDWLDKLGLQVPTTYDEYLDVLRAFVNNDPDGNGQNDTMGVTAAGIIGTEAPFTNYLPEFWQDSYPSFYEKDGQWVDGFSEQATADALQRLKDAYTEGLIDMEVATNKTSACRDKYYAGQVGAFTYWAGKWAGTIDDNLKALDENASIVAIPPIKELGQYTERQAPVIAITNKCENPAGVFKYLFETMVDGDKGQMIFNYGAEGTHYTKDASGAITLLPDPENEKNKFTSIFVDPLLGISTWTNGDPLDGSRNPLIQESNDTFMTNAKLAPVIVSNDTMSNYASQINDIKTVLVSDIVTGNTSVEDGMASYKEQTDSMVQEILASLNN